MFGKKRLFARMRSYVDILQVVMCEAALRHYPEMEKPEGRRVIVAATNILAGKPSVGFSESELDRGRELAPRLLKVDADIRLCSAQCLRTQSVTEGDADLSKFRAIEWVATFGPLPPEAVNPNNMGWLAHDMGTKYGVVTVKE